MQFEHHKDTPNRPISAQSSNCFQLSQFQLPATFEVKRQARAWYSMGARWPAHSDTIAAASAKAAAIGSLRQCQPFFLKAGASVRPERNKAHWETAERETNTVMLFSLSAPAMAMTYEQKK